MHKIRWGVLSTAKIGTEKVIPAIQQSAICEVAAIGSRDLKRAQNACKSLGIDQAYGSYEELLADTQIDAIYNPLPNHLHVPWSIAAMEAGKHVLCEKPIALSVQEANQLLQAAESHPQLKIMEAFMYRHHPQWKRAKEIVDGGGIGELRTIQSFFSYFNDDTSNIRNQADIGGGGLMDIGCYCISLARFLYDSEPTRVCGMVEYDPNMKTDRLASGMLDFERGSATFTCSTQLTPYQRVQLFGTSGRVEIEIPFNAPHDRPCKIWHEQQGKIEEILLPQCNQYTIQADLFARAILDDQPVPTPLHDAVANMVVLEQMVNRSA